VIIGSSLKIIQLFPKRYSISHCDWIEDSVFFTSDPGVINEQFIEYSSNSFDVIVNTGNTSNQMCLYATAMNFNCSVDELQPIYPGQNYSLRLIVESASSAILDFQIDESPFTSCKTQTALKRYNMFQNSCTTVELNIQESKKL